MRCDVPGAELQPTGNGGRRHAGISVLAVGQPSPDQRFEQIVRPFEVEDAQKEVYRDENHRPMPETLRVVDSFHGQLQKDNQNGRINEAPDGNPRRIKQHTDGVLPHCRTYVPTFVNDTAQNEEPCIDLDRQTRPHEPPVLRKGHGRREISNGNNVVLNDGRIGKG